MQLCQLKFQLKVYQGMNSPVGKKDKQEVQ